MRTHATSSKYRGVHGRSTEKKSNKYNCANNDIEQWYANKEEKNLLFL